MDYAKLITTLYTEQDFDRSVGTSVAGASGLLTYVFSGDWVLAVFAAVTVFPLSRLIARITHLRWEANARKLLEQREVEMQLAKFSAREREVLRFFVDSGGCCVSISLVNNSSRPFPRSALNSLMERGLVQTTWMEDGMSEGFSLDVDTFDLAQKLFPRVQVAEG